jgi:hypothetical protein
MLDWKYLITEAALLLAVVACPALGQYGFVGQPIATIVPPSGDNVTSLYITPLVNTTEGANLLHDDGKTFGTGWMGGADVAAAEGATWLHDSNAQKAEGGGNAFVHLDGVSAAVGSLTLNGQLRGKGGVKAVMKAAPAPDLVCGPFGLPLFIVVPPPPLSPLCLFLSLHLAHIPSLLLCLNPQSALAGLRLWGV